MNIKNNYFFGIFFNNILKIKKINNYFRIYKAYPKNYYKLNGQKDL